MSGHTGTGGAGIPVVLRVAVVLGLVFLLIVVAQWGRTAVLAGVCPTIPNTPVFTIVYGRVTLNGADAPPGTVVEARSPRGETAGCFVVEQPGTYGAMYVYGADTLVAPPVPGMGAGEPVSFTVSGLPGEANPALVWTNDLELHQVDLSAVGTPPTPTPTATPVPVAVQVDMATGPAVQHDNLIVEVPPGTVAGQSQIAVAVRALSTVAPPAGGFSLGHTRFELTITAEDQPVRQLDQPLTLTIHYTDDDVAAAGGDPQRLSLQYYDPAQGQWVPVPAVVDATARTLTAQVTHLTAFALLTDVPPVPTAVVPPAGGSGGGGGGGSGSSPAAISPSGTISPTTGGRVGLTGVTVSFPSGAVAGTSGFSATVEPLDLTAAAQGDLQATLAVPVPEGFMLGTRAFQVTARDSNGDLLTSFAQAATLSVTVAAEDVRRAGGNLGRIMVRRYDPAARTWVELPARTDGPNVVGADTLTPGVFGLLIALPVPETLGPPTDSLAASMAPELRWSVPSGTVWYQVQVLPYNLDGPAINLIIGDPAMVASGSYPVAAPKLGVGNYVLLPGMSYVWRVRTSPQQAPAGEHDPIWSNWASSGFRTPTPFPSGLTLQSPADGGAVESLMPTLTWAHTDDRIFYYEVQVSQDPHFQTDPNLATAAVYWELVHGGLTTPVNSYTIRSAFPLEPAMPYFWRVRPRIQGDGQPAAWSPARTFRTPPRP